MTRDIPTTIMLAVLSAIALVGSAAATWRIGAADDRPIFRQIQTAAFFVLCILCPLVEIYRLVFVHEGWRPLSSHADGLVLIACLVGPTAAFLQYRARIRGLTAFALPVLALVLLWSVCASWWTFHPFSVTSMWKGFHLATVYVGSACVLFSAVAGAMYLYGQRALHRKIASGLTRVASLESLERLMIVCAGVGFALLTVALASGVVIVTSVGTRMGPGWWHSPKVILAVLAWLIYALLMNVRHTAFRGSRAAWLSIAGFALILATFGVVSALDRAEARGPEATRQPVMTGTEQP